MTLGTIKAKGGLVVWTMQPWEARELADALDDFIANPKDTAYEDIKALQDAAESIEPTPRKSPLRYGVLKEDRNSE